MIDLPSDKSKQRTNVSSWEALGLQTVLVVERCRRGHVTTDEAVQDLEHFTGLMSLIASRTEREAGDE